MPDISKLWDAQYLFAQVPIELQRSDYFYVGVAAAFVVFAILSKLWVIKTPKDSPVRFLCSRFYHLFLTMGLFMLVWGGARVQSIPWISTHFVVLFLIFIWLVWLGFILKYFIWSYPNQRKLWEEESVKRKYLP